MRSILFKLIFSFLLTLSLQSTSELSLSPDELISPSNTSDNYDNDDDYPDMTYEEIFNLFHLQYPQNSYNLNPFKPAKPEIISSIIIDNFVEAHLVYLDKKILRINFFRLIGWKAKWYDDKILYKIMQNRTFMEFLGYDNCFYILKEIFRTFLPIVHNSKVEKISRSISTQLNDFLEFLLEELIPRYNLKAIDKFSDIIDECFWEYPAMFLLVERTIKFSWIILFKEVDLLRTIMKRYSRIWVPELTANYMNSLKKYSSQDLNLFREIFTILVKSVPDFFVQEYFMSQYFALTGPFGISQIMTNMAPILRALMVLDEEDTVKNYLTLYWRQIALVNGPPLYGDGSHMTVMESFIRDSNFSFTTSTEMFQKKGVLFEKILSTFFGIKRENYFKFASICVKKNHLAIYEVLLKFYPNEISSFENISRLLNGIITNSQIPNPFLAATMTVGYLLIETDWMDEILLFVKESFKNHPSVQVIVRFKFLENLFFILKDCPIKESSGIVVGKEFARVPWPCPKIDFSSHPETHPILFNYAQLILCKRFSIPFWSVSLFDCTMDEAATWSEAIGYINFVIEMMGSYLGYNNVNFFKFVDTTKKY